MSLTFKRAVYKIPTDTQRLSRWVQRLYKVLQTHTKSIDDADIQYKAFARMATPSERKQLAEAYEVIKTAFLGEYDKARKGDKPSPVVPYGGMRYDAAKWHKDYVAFHHYRKDVAWLDSQFSVV